MQEFEDIAWEGLMALILALRERVTVLEAENATLRGQLEQERGKQKGLEWVKAARPVRTKQRSQGHARRRAVPTEVHLPAVEACPEWGRRLLGDRNIGGAPG